MTNNYAENAALLALDLCDEPDDHPALPVLEQLFLAGLIRFTDKVAPEVTDETREMIQIYRVGEPPVTVHAVCFSTNNEVESPTMDAIVNWVNQGKQECGAWHNGTNIFVRQQRSADWIWERATVGDWITMDAEFSFYVVRADDFAHSYALVRAALEVTDETREMKP